MQNELILIAETELLDLVRDEVSLPAHVREDCRADLGITLLRAGSPTNAGARRDLRDLRDQLEALSVLSMDKWLTAVEADHALRRYEPVAWAYLLAKDSDQVADYLGFGACFAGPALGGYRVVRVPEMHLEWMQLRLASGMQLGCSDVFASYADAAAGAEALHA